MKVPDGGFSATLPYKSQDGTTRPTGLGGGEEAPQSMSNVVTVPRPQNAGRS